MISNTLEKIYNKNIEDEVKETIYELSTNMDLHITNDPILNASLISPIEATQYIISESNQLGILSLKYSCVNDYYKKIDMSMLRIEEISIEEGYTISEAMDIIKSIFLAVNNIYGFVLVNKKTNIRMNVLHPLIMIRLLEENLENERYSVITYTYDTIDNCESCDFKDEIIDLIVATSKVSETITRISDINSSGTRVTYEKVSLDTNGAVIGDNVSKLSIIPSHLLGKEGLIYPNYATILILQKDRNTKGKNLSPIFSANIAEPNENNFVSICTGDFLKNSNSGLQTLAHSNLDSPMNIYIVVENYRQYATACMHASLELYYGDYKNETEQEETDTNNTSDTESNRSEESYGLRDSSIHAEGYRGIPEEEWDEWSL